MDTIVVATDFSAPSWAALQLASTLASDHHARLLIVHVQSPEVMHGVPELDAQVQPLTDTIGQERLQQMVPPHHDVAYERHLLTGPPAEEILRFAREQRGELIVVGTHGRTGARRLLMGSVAEQLVRHAPCPVLTVKAPASPAP